MSSHTRANSLGYGCEEIARAVHDQLMRVHYIGTVDNFVESAVRLAAKIAALAPGKLDHVMYVSGGSEAVEAHSSLPNNITFIAAASPGHTRSFRAGNGAAVNHQPRSTGSRC